MVTAIAQKTVLVVGVVVCLFALWAMIAPQRVKSFVRVITDTPWGYLVAAGFRLLLGAVLILAAPSSRFPTPFQILGWITIAAAVALLVMGQRRMQRLIGWFYRLPNSLMRAWLLLALVFGAFLVYGAS